MKSSKHEMKTFISAIKWTVSCPVRIFVMEDDLLTKIAFWFDELVKEAEIFTEFILGGFSAEI